MAESSHSQVFRDGLLEGQVCVVSGAGTGIGRETVLELARLGATVVGCGRRTEPLAETAELARGLPGSFEHEALDIRDYDPLIFRRWREELLSEDAALEQIVRDELTARVRRLDREGWRDLRDVGEAMHAARHGDAERMLHVERMARYISEHALDAISVDEVARSVNLHPNYAMTIYKRAVGLTINQSIVRQRLDTAQSLLIASDMTIANIAFEAGFSSLSRFYEAFRQRFGCQPGAFRRRLAKASKQIGAAGARA